MRRKPGRRAVDPAQSIMASEDASADELIQQHCKVWDELGLTQEERETEMGKIGQRAAELVEMQIEEAKKLLGEYEAKADAQRERIHMLDAELGGEDLGSLDNVGGTLISQCSQFKRICEKLEQKKALRRNVILAQLTKLKHLCNELGTPLPAELCRGHEDEVAKLLCDDVQADRGADSKQRAGPADTVRNIGAYSKERIADLEEAEAAAKKEIEERSNGIVSLVREVVILRHQLGSTSGLPPHPVDAQVADIVNKSRERDAFEISSEHVHQIGLKLEAIESLKQHARSLELIKIERGREIGVLQEAIKRIWERLQTSEAQRAEFIAVVDDMYTPSTIEQYRKYLSTLRNEQVQKMNSIITRVLGQIQRALEDMLVGEDAIKRVFAALPKGVPAEQDEEGTEGVRAVELLEAKLAETVTQLDHMSPALKLIKKREDMNRKLAEFDESKASAPKNPDRFKQRDYCKTLRREENMQSIRTAKLPRIERKIKSAIKAYEQQHGQPFVVRGQRYLDTLAAEIRAAEERAARMREEKERRMAEKKRERKLELQRRSIAPCTPRRTPRKSARRRTTGPSSSRPASRSRSRSGVPLSARPAARSRSRGGVRASRAASEAKRAESENKENQKRTNASAPAAAGGKKLDATTQVRGQVSSLEAEASKLEGQGKYAEAVEKLSDAIQRASALPVKSLKVDLFIKRSKVYNLLSKPELARDDTSAALELEGGP